MSGLKSTAQRAVNFVGGKGFKTRAEKRAEVAAEVTSEKNRMFSDAAAPDPEELRRAARRKQASRRGSRASTVLSDTKDTLG